MASNAWISSIGCSLDVKGIGHVEWGFASIHGNHVTIHVLTLYVPDLSNLMTKNLGSALLGKHVKYYVGEDENFETNTAPLMETLGAPLRRGLERLLAGRMEMFLETAQQLRREAKSMWMAWQGLIPEEEKKNENELVSEPEK